MRNLIRAAIAVYFSTMVTVPISHAQSSSNGAKRDVQELYNLCKAEARSFGATICLGYISGVGDLMDVNAVEVQSGDVNEFLFSVALCGKPSYGAMVQAFKNWAEKHPEHWSEPWILGVLLAMHETFPCRKTSN